MNAKEIGKRLIKLRGDRTQAEVAKAIGISASTLSMYENGERIPRDNIKLKLSNYYNRKIEAIFFVKNDHETWPKGERWSTYLITGS